MPQRKFLDTEDVEHQRRRKRHVRDENPEPMLVTERDVRIIEAVYQCRVLRQDQLHRLFFGSATSASQRRLMLLFQHGV